MRVIAGTHRSRLLHAPAGDETRPTHARVREALFSILGQVTDFAVLDLCAGTGALGIEALSRGASRAVFVESAKDAARCLSRNLSELELTSQSTLLQLQVKAARPRLLELGPFDLILCDPPWDRAFELVRTLETIPLHRLLTQSGVFILEHSVKTPPKPDAISELQLDDTRHWGDSAVSFFSRRTAPLDESPDATPSP